MEIVQFTFNPIQENTYLVIDEQKNALIIDPGCYFKEEKQMLSNYIKKNKLQMRAILNTHAHLDHIMGNAFMKKEFGLDIYLHKKDLPTLSMSKISADLYGFNLFEPSPMPDIELIDNEIINFGEISFQVIFGPGHAPGHVAFYNAENKILINGDILFKGSYGRFDLPGGDFEALKKTITQTLFKLPDDTIVYTGHGDRTTIGEEKTGNPILF